MVNIYNNNFNSLEIFRIQQYFPLLATKDIRNEDFSGQNLAGKDFTQCGWSSQLHFLLLLIRLLSLVPILRDPFSHLNYIDASNAIFRKAKLAGSRFYRANLKEADFSGAG